ncbi:MAG TPA: twin-arginine translocase TatA/TatE family subunit [Acidobacteriota bacterium]|nr:twin-arginine translocase TatA/TatE family subunit [Acidobacteriota bacterium]
MGGLGFGEIVVIFVVALVIFGPRKLPELGKSLGKGLAEFKKASNELRRTWEEEVETEKQLISDTVEEQKKVFKETADLTSMTASDTSKKSPQTSKSA